MPLSEQEQRLLDEMERHLYRSDADFVSKVSSGKGKPSYRGIALGSLIAVVGAIGLVLGVVLQQPIIGLVGFAVMLTGVLVATKPTRAPLEAPKPRSTASASAKPTRLMDRLNDRWDKRQSGDGQE
ncbi:MULTISPECIES: DUF3040 domain-containing protein [unclassified Plantibacter]|uniref:DUF3040 domain-containing protein n=1 Tax=unclassified Plantibacter TaxID=2624265 RepID=UPI003D34580B